MAQSCLPTYPRPVLWITLPSVPAESWSFVIPAICDVHVGFKCNLPSGYQPRGQMSLRGNDRPPPCLSWPGQARPAASKTTYLGQVKPTSWPGDQRHPARPAQPSTEPVSKEPFS
ncbi:hypothetical protein GGR56DRAFT_94214 [Xylariaceae sp. FL0804]|nr:hypothetical protein GGR56DRAFT_94214 [Xylariaceae sp. FL0804]